jgi:integrase
LARLEPSTLRGYDLVLTAHALPAFGGRQLASLKTAHLQAWCNGILERGLSAKTASSYLTRLNVMLNRAVELNHIVRNPRKGVKLPRVPRRDLTIVTPAQMKALLSAASGSRLEALLVLSLATGLRQGEALGLTWDRVNFDESEIHINKAAYYAPGKNTYLKRPKTPGSVRTLLLPSTAMEALRRHRIRQAEEALAGGKAWTNPLGLVFCNRVGGFVDQSNLASSDFKRWLSAAGLPHMRWHDLRHTAASMMLSRGVPVPVVTSMLGHADPSITLKLYSWAIPGDQKLAADAMEALLAG